jgi:hypothetical protein
MHGALRSLIGFVRDVISEHRACSENKELPNVPVPAARTRKRAGLVKPSELCHKLHELGKRLYSDVVAGIQLQNAPIIPEAG